MTTEDPDIQEVRKIMARIAQERREAQEAHEITDRIKARSRQPLGDEIQDLPLSSLSAPPCEPIQGARVTVCDRDGQVEACIVDAQGQTMHTMRGAAAMIFLRGFLGCDVWASDTALTISARARKSCEIHYRLSKQEEKP